MNSYKIYTDLKGNIETVKMGWSWSAFVFTWIWALKKKVWSITTLTTGILILSISFSFIITAITPELAPNISFNILFIYGSYLILGFSFLMGVKGSQWYENTLLKKGAVFQSIIIAKTSEEAIVFYAEKNTEKYLMVA
jgi:hypothetical protein